MRGHPPADPPQPLHGASKFVRRHARVTVGRVEVLVPEQVLHLAQVGVGA